jgi:hypothetical protein
MFRDDWLSRQIRELADAIARAFDASAAGKVADAEEALAEGWNGLLPNGRDLVAAIDATSVLGMLGTEERARGALALLVAEAELAEARGDRAAQESALRLGRTLAAAARARWPALSDDPTVVLLDGPSA